MPSCDAQVPHAGGRDFESTNNHGHHDSIWFLYFVNAMQSSILSNLLPYATSEWETHSLLNVIYVVASAMSAAIYVPLSKILDVWGRAEGFAVMTTFATIGMIMMAASHNLPTFCAAYVRKSLILGPYGSSLQQGMVWR